MSLKYLHNTINTLKQIPLLQTYFVLMEPARYFNNMNRIYLKQLIKEVIQEFEVSDDDIEIKDNDHASFKEIMDQVGIDYSSIEIDGIDERDAPDFVDTYVSYAEWNDGIELTDEELEQLNNLEEFQILAQEKAYERIYM